MSATDFSLTPHFGRTIINQVMSLLGKDVSLADHAGTLVASYDPGQAGTKLPAYQSVSDAKDAIDLPDDAGVGFAIKRGGETIGALVIHADPKTVKEFIPITRSLVELLVEQEAEQTLTGNLEQLLWQLFHSVTDAERERLVSEAKLQGVDLTTPRFVALLHVPGFAEQLAKTTDKVAPITRFKEKVNREVAAIFPSSADNTITYFGQDRFLLLKDAGKGEETVKMFRQKTPQMMKNLGSESGSRPEQVLTVGIGGLHLGVEGLMTSYREANAALRLGMKLHSPGKPYYIDDIGLYIVFSDVGIERQLRLAKKLLAPLLKEPDLLKTVRAYFDQNLNLTKAAEQLHIHRNTLIYRLGKIKDLTGLDPELFENAVQIKIALVLLDLE